MKSSPLRSADQIALGATTTLFAISLLWVAWGEREIAASAQLPEPIADSVTDVARQPRSAPSSVEERWLPPARPSEWGFDLFTPPVVYYDAAAGRFTVSPAGSDSAPVEQVAQGDFGLTLLGIDRESYALQLVGYAGETGNYLGIFQNERTGEGLVARAGDTIASLGVQIRSLEVRREDTIVPDSMPLREMVAVAEVWDQSAARLVRLSSAGWRWVDAPVARVRLTATGEVRAVRTGDVIAAAGATFEIRAVTATPATVVVGKRHPDDTREVMTLGAEIPDSPQFESDSPFAAP